VTADLAWLLGVLGGVVVVAALVNRLAPVHRPRLRRAVVLFALTASAYAGSLIFGAMHNERWARYFAIASEGARLIVVIDLAGLLVFLVLLPRFDVAMPVIVGELFAGVGYVVAILGVLDRHQIDLTGALATGAVVSAVLAISMQQTLGNILGGIALQLDRSVREGNWIQFENGKQGRIRAIRWRHTIVETRDYQTIVVPNAWLLANNIMILGQRDGKAVPLRCWAYFSVDYRFSPVRVCSVIDESLRGSPIDNVAEDPAPTCLCLEFGKDQHDSYTYYGVQYWARDMNRSDSTGSRVRKRIFAALQRAQIPLAIPANRQLLELHDAAHDERHTTRRASEHLAAIKTVGLLRSLDEAELHTLADGLVPAPFVAGEIVTRQGAIAHYLYILTSGSCEVRTKVDPEGVSAAPTLTRTVATLTAPDFFGEMGLVTGAPRTADVVAVTDVECFRLEKSTFERVLLARPKLAVELSDKLAERRMGLIAAREGLGDAARKEREETERAKILHGIRSFFALG
jgi:CRP-like cAMP-binding protein/small-conductance mechanosensitive channel